MLGAILHVIRVGYCLVRYLGHLSRRRHYIISRGSVDMAFSLKSMVSLVLRLTLIGRLGLILHREATEACHTTIVYIQNGTWLNTSRWRQNGFFGHLDRLPIAEKPNKTFHDPTTWIKVYSNDVVPYVSVSFFQSFFFLLAAIILLSLSRDYSRMDWKALAFFQN